MSIDDIVAEKQLDDKTTLKVVTWVSDQVRPGQRMYHLELTEAYGYATTKYPINFEDFSKDEITGMYDSIHSKKDFEKMMRGD